MEGGIQIAGFRRRDGCRRRRVHLDTRGHPGGVRPSLRSKAVVVAGPGGINGLLAVAGDTLLVPVGMANPPQLVALKIGASGFSLKEHQV